MDEVTLRAMLEGYWRSTAQDAELAHEIYHEDAVLEFPQSGERFAGKRNLWEWRGRYPVSVTAEVGRIRGRDDFWVAEMRITYDGGPRLYGVTILEFRGDKIAHETIYGGEAWEAPEWRAPWRAGP